MLRIVLDTNCLISSLKRDSVYYPIWKGFMNGDYCLCVTDEILNEYEEIIEQRTGSKDVAHNVIHAILNRSNTLHVNVYYHFNMINTDRDDNKFVDCAIKSSADFIVTNDRHFDVLETIPFPHVDVMDINQFLTSLNHETNNQ